MQHFDFLCSSKINATLLKLVNSFDQDDKNTLYFFSYSHNHTTDHTLSTWKEQLENLCFKYLYPEHHQELSSKLAKFFDEVVVTSSLEKLEQALKAGGISYHCLSARRKSLYSIYSKMLKLIVESEEDCYKALRVVQQLWHEVPGRFKDYIIYSKFNGYQSLHTVVTGDCMIPFEVQIRSKEMHLQAEYGFAAHWRYKEGDYKHSSFVLQMVEWARWVISHCKDCAFSYKPDCSSDEPVFVIMLENDKMSVQEFPANSSVKDVLERACRGSSRFPMKEELRPRLNHEPVSDPTRKLKIGDVVELTPAIPDKSLTEYREEIQRMYDQGLTVVLLAKSSVASFRS